MRQSLFDDFWEASSLDAHGAGGFAAVVPAPRSTNADLLTTLGSATDPLPLPAAPEPEEHAHHRMRHGHEPPPPPPPVTFDAVLRARRSRRDFAGEGLSPDDWGSILGVLRALNGPERRAYASAGALYPVETFVVEFVRDGRRRMAWYNPVEHELVHLRHAPPTWSEAAPTLGFDTSPPPAGAILGVVFPQRVTDTYGLRGERFALLEAGAMVQLLGMAVATRRDLAGLTVGGAHDHHWIHTLGLPTSRARLAFLYLVGKTAH